MSSVASVAAKRQESSGQTLRQTHDIRADAGPLRCEHRTRSSETGQAFVGDEQDAVIPGEFPDALEEG